MKKKPSLLRILTFIPILTVAVLVLNGCAHPQGRTVATATGAPEAGTIKATRTVKTAKTAKTAGAGKKPAARPQQGTIMVGQSFRVRTTAYTGTRNAISKPLSHGPIISAASDWSRFPLGTRFRVRETGRVYEIDDYGSALVGTHTIDLAKTGKNGVNAWGVRWVNIDIIRWGSPRRSLEVLTPRVKYRHIRPMVVDLRKQTEGVPSQFHRIGL